MQSVLPELSQPPHHGDRARGGHLRYPAAPRERSPGGSAPALHNRLGRSVRQPVLPPLAADHEAILDAQAGADPSPHQRAALDAPDLVVDTARDASADPG